ncbi:MAG TPA: hypothetical protein EYO51_05000 [Methylococcaceae bacterium]|jgi:hypothetical protein|nr:hypothetical protein [Methylococcaceae bacterium]HIB62489.1 hypothetical protein [Methylococcaceae bacterium]HIN69570.1 hypothetical protein [Methylococcales bacterium]HIO12581.1 hypothetical protein [Methylococcales bacterium]
MTKLFLILSLFVPLYAHAVDDSPEKWQPTTLSDASIKKIQTAKHQYNQCISKEITGLNIGSLDVRDAAHHIIKSCEEKLSIIRQTFLDENVSTLLADRYLKMSRTQTTRTTLKHLMFLDAAKKMGYPGAK